MGFQIEYSISIFIIQPINRIMKKIYCGEQIAKLLIFTNHKNKIQNLDLRLPLNVIGKENKPKINT